MPGRKFAQFRLSMWNDDDWLDLNPAEQHLYTVVLTSPELTLAGVTDWRPKRIAKRARGWSPDLIERTAASLVDRLFLVIDEDTEEALVRSFVRHDGIVDQPNMMTGMARAYGAIASPGIRRVLVHELKRLHDQHPDAKGWNSREAVDLLDRPSVDPSTYPCGNPSGKGSPNPSGSPSGTPSGRPSGKGSRNPSTNPSPTPAPAPSTSHQAPSESLRDSGDAPAPPLDAAATITPQAVTAAWVDACTANGVTPSGGQKGNVGKLAKELLRTNDPERVLEAARQAGARGHVAIDRELTVMHGRAVVPIRVAAPTRPSTTDSRVQMAYDLAAEFDGYAEPEPAKLPAIGGTTR